MRASSQIGALILPKVLKQPMQPVDHRVAWSLYFSDPDGNPFEITCYDYDALSAEFRNSQPA